MKDLFRAELIKITTTRTARATMAGIVLASGFIVTMASLAIPESEAAELKEVVGVSGGLFALLGMMILGILGAAGEFQHRTIVSAYLISPRRSPLLAVKLTAHALIGLLTGALTSAIAVGIGSAIASARGLELDLMGGPGRMIAITAGSAAVFACLGVILGSIVRAPVAAVVGACAWVTVGESLLGAVVPRALLPFAGVLDLMGVEDAGSAPWVAGVALVAYAVGGAVLAWRVFLPRDVTP